MPHIRHLLTIDAPPEVVFRAVTTHEGLAGWWTRENVAEARVGAILEFKFGDHYHNKMRLTRLEADRRVEWECLQGDKEWVGTRFFFDLQDQNDKTLLRFGHDDWREVTDFYANCNTHWAHYMNSLKAYCETGRGTPFDG
ncbi:MAG: SRPBCC domain-containing protein [Phycisphaerae bacterium]|nr:SRPBCC domain-containing protein [Phycisphaerae bacterium]